ncbi:MAG: hypothetical protein JSV79_11200 [Armatimonadota bacterium]|nr:MAG: hypothetical protein JSV79_11200 [Armatimonadota bacterium]
MRIAAKGFACIILTAVVTLSPALGCGRRASHTRAPASPVEEGPSIPLPEWAPENPSPEFLRAARVLKPWPEERPAEEDLAQRAVEERYRLTLPVAWELFGALTDAQMERFLSTKEIRLPVKSLSEKQRLTLDRWFDAWRDAMQGEGQYPDWLVVLYKTGAREDLSNVDVGFDSAGRRVHICFWVSLPNGDSLRLGNGIADI